MKIMSWDFIKGKKKTKKKTKSSNKMPPIKRSFKFMPQPLPYIQTKPLNITTLNAKKKRILFAKLK